MNNTLNPIVKNQIETALKNYQPRCCSQCRYETGLDRCQLDPDIDTENVSNLRRHPSCPIEKKGGKK